MENNMHKQTMVEKVQTMIDDGLNVSDHSLIEYLIINENLELDVIHLLIDYGVDINKADDGDKKTPILIAAKQGNVELLKLLIKNGAKLNDTDNFGNTPLLYAMEKSDIKLISFLIKNGADVNFGNIYTGNTPLMQICQRGRVSGDVNNNTVEIDIVTLMLEKGVDVNIKDKRGRNAHFFAQKYGKETISDLLKDHGSDVNITLNENSELMLASSDGDLDKVKLLIESDIDVNLQNENGNTALVFAVSEHNKDVVELLLQNNAYANCDVTYKSSNAKYRYVEPVLIYAVSLKCKLDIIELLIKYGSDVNAWSSHYISTALISAIDSNNFEVAQLLIKNGADVNDNLQGESALKYAVEQDNTRIVKLLLDNDAKRVYYTINGEDGQFHEHPVAEIAVTNSNMEMIDLLLNYKKDIGNHNPKRLVKLLTKFTTDNPLKYTTHMWDFGDIKRGYDNFQDFLRRVEEEWNEISEELKELSPSLYNKIYTFLLNKDTNADSWCSKSDISVGWSSLDTLDECANKGDNPFDLELKETYVVNNQTISTFGEVINLFKKEIEIRNENNMLEAIFLQQKNKLGRKFIVNLIKLKGRTFYTDVETFRNTIDRIFVEIKKRDSLNHVEVEVIEPDEKSIAIKITHMGSTSGKDAAAMLEEAKDGDFKIMKENLKNLCDWSIESSYEGENYRVNYLKNSNTEDMESLSYRPNGFTHLLRFYKK